mmetsp:Transcript_16298/g.14225  ORF Transcript_16298/g.14225 Transcript_16298/m.14225 type:complete len:102 (-) Transcript_16298:14-319(-)
MYCYEEDSTDSQVVNKSTFKNKMISKFLQNSNDDIVFKMKQLRTKVICPKLARIPHKKINIHVLRKHFQRSQQKQNRIFSEEEIKEKRGKLNRVQKIIFNK